MKTGRVLSLVTLVSICKLFPKSRATPFSLNKILGLSSTRNVHYAIFSPNNTISIEYQHSTESVNYNKSCSELTLEAFSHDVTARPIVVCGNENVTMFRETVEQIASITSSNQIDLLKWAPYYFLVWPTVIENSNEAERSMKRISAEYGRHFHVNTDVFVIFMVSDRLDMGLWEFYGIGKENIYREIKLTNQSVHMDDLDGKISRRANFQNMTIRATAVKYDNFDLDVKFKNNSDEFEGGMNVKTLQFLQDSFNFSIKSFSGNWTQESENSRVQGIPDQISDDSIDICITEFYVTQRRSAYLKFLHPTYAETLKAYFTEPAPSDFRNIFLIAFQWDLWIALGLTYIVLVVVLKLFLWITIHCINQEKLGDGSVNSDLYTESFIFVVGVAAQQGWHIQPESKSIRVIFLVGYLTGLVCFVAYSAAIVSTLSIKREYVTSFDNLVDKNYQILADYDVNPLEWVKDRLAFRNRTPVNMPVSLALRKIATSRAAFISHADEVYPVLREKNLDNSVEHEDHEICERIRYINIGNSVTKYAMILKKGSYLADFFNSRLLREMEYGILRRLLIDHMRTGRVTCNLDDINVHQALGMEDVYTAYFILSIGYVSSLLALIVEVLLKKKPFEAIVRTWAR